MHVVRFELSAETFATLRQARQLLDEEHGSHLSDDELVATLSGAVLGGRAATEPSGRAKFQIAVTLCERCGQGWQDGAGARLAIDGAAVERARCDAQYIGSLDSDSPERAHQDVPPSVARLVWRRDGGRCRVPGCRSARNLEVHHLVHRTDGGGHEAENLILTCGSCHMAHHRGALTISGTVDRIEIERHAATMSRPPGAPPQKPTAHVCAAGVASETNGHEADGAAAAAKRVATEVRRPEGKRVAAEKAKRPEAKEAAAKPKRQKRSATEASELDAAIVRAQTKDALVSLGWTPAIATAAVSAAAATFAGDLSLERLIREALRRCPVPRS